MSDKLPAGCNCIDRHWCEESKNPFKGGNMIRHRDTLDMDIAILNVEYETDDYIKLKILYCNRNNNTLFDMKNYKVTIKASDKHKWRFVKKHSY